MIWRELLAETAAEFGRAQARWLCETASGCDAAEFTLELEAEPTQRMVAHLDAMLIRLRAGEPLQYVLGHWSFRHLDLMVDERVLIPRPETEEVVEVALSLVRGRSPLRCADLGCGSGAIGLSLAFELPLDSTEVWLTDVSAEALHVARANAAGIGRAAANVRFAEGAWFTALDPAMRASFDLIVSNPPYVAEGSAEIEPIVVDHEPHVALFGGTDGYAALDVIIPAAAEWLAPGGWLVLEIGSEQGDAVAARLHAAGLREVEIRHDAAGHDRIALARH